jgi:hypothetical protein
VRTYREAILNIKIAVAFFPLPIFSELMHGIGRHNVTKSSIILRPPAR